MSELEMTTDSEAAEFTDDLSDEALDRAERPAAVSSGGCHLCFCILVPGTN